MRKPTREPPSDFFVLLDEEFGFALWFWVPGMPGGALEAWWRAVDAAPPGGSPLFFDRRRLPGRCLLADRDTWSRLYTEGGHWSAHAHWEDDSHLARPDGTITYHRGHPDFAASSQGFSDTPRWMSAPALTRARLSTAGDAQLGAELWDGGARVRIYGTSEEECGCDQSPVEQVRSLDEVAAIAEALATGRDTTRSTNAYGRADRSTWSLSPPSDSFEPGRHLWFYPMDQHRSALRIEADPLRAALDEQLAWLDVAAPGLPADARAVLREVRRFRAAAGAPPRQSLV